MLLYSARKRDQEPTATIGDQNELSRPLLFSPIVPPAEAFLVFSNQRFAADYDDLSFCQSPIPRVLTASNIEVADEETLSTDSEPGGQTVEAT